MTNVYTTLRTIRVRIPTALEVYLLGEFNNWSTTATPMRATPDGGWEVSLPKSASLSRIVFFVWKAGERVGQIWPQWAEDQVIPDLDAGSLSPPPPPEAVPA